MLLVLVEGVCAKTRALRNAGITPHQRRYFEKAWRRCGFEKDQVATKEMHARWPGLTLWVGLLYRLLMENGVTPQRALATAQAWLGPHPRLPAALQATDLPSGTSLRPLHRETLVVLGAPAPPPGKKPVALCAKAKTTYREVLEAARRLRSGAGEVLLVVRGQDGEPALLSLRVRDPAAPDSTGNLGLRLELKRAGIRIVSRHGEEWKLSTPSPPQPNYTRLPDVLKGSALEQIHRALFSLQAGKYKGAEHYGPGEDRHRLSIEADPDLPLDTLVQVLDAIREIPRGSRQPPTPADVPKGGCRMRRDPLSGRWAYPDVAGESLREKACLYDQAWLR